MSDIDADTVRDAAAEYGLAFDDATVEEHLSGAQDLLAQFELLDPGLPDSVAAENVRSGDDEHNAFFRRFDLDSESGPLSDLTVAAKENIAVAGVPMSCGSAGFEFTPEYSGTVIRRLRSAGADIVGTTNMDEFALYTTGETCAHGRIENPEAPGHVPGGSSGGSGAAVATGAVDAALGSDTGGSIRIPASFCGVVGLKPTHRSVSRFGFVDLAASLDHVGPLADSVETAAHVFDAIAGPDPADPSTHVSSPPANVADAVGDPVEDLRIGLVTDAFDASTDAVAASVREAVEEPLVAVDEVSLPTLESLVALSGIIGSEFAALVEENGQVYGTGTGYSEPWRAALADTDVGELGENVRDQLVAGKAIDEATDGAAYVAAQGFRREFTAMVQEHLAAYDALVTPTTPRTALEFGAVQDRDDLIETLANTGPFNLTGHPALSVPCGEVDGQPVGLQIVTDWHGEPTSVALGSAIESL